MEKVCAILLAAGDGKRMKSQKPKVLCEVLFQPMITWVTNALAEAGIENCCAVLGSGVEQVRAVLPEHYATALQQERKGTGHAVMMAADYIKSGGFTDVVVLCGDAPLIKPQDIKAVYGQHKADGNAATVFVAHLSDPAGYGRIVRDKDGGVSAIVEQADADPKTQKINEINAGVYWFDAKFLLEALDGISTSNAKGEYYLTDTVGAAVKGDRRVGAYTTHFTAAMGANDRLGLSALNKMAQYYVLDRLLSDGVDIPFRDQVVVGPNVKISADTTILPGCILKGDTTIGEGCEIGPNTQLTNTVVGNGCKVVASFVDSSQLEDGVSIGPMANIRPGCVIGQKVKIGDFVEVKSSVIGAKSAISHLSYVGDSDVGEGCNLGCGIVTVNYDGKNKHRTVIGSESFIGCNTNLIAPITLGDRVYCAAGTTLTEDVPSEALVIGRCRQTVKENKNKDGLRFKKSNR
ncbi:MAG: bifunctional UDP-N-acetylglucosamine diphosphorylase/glucosamine-1-phosphate N-acetyltransferase GlmU [Oscillospiraceae bacterium]|nr:bifunctional UDP-N-acetylglucosamine diphosphorylase/glucosamine-1-phosphate N-acetyltransferase GlmU [Oscillospiraceae bacterium]